MIKDTDCIITTQHELSAAFTEWERRVRENPERFQSDMERLSTDISTQGDLQSAYFVEILEDNTLKAMIEPPTV